jgi:hypothetical protein
MTLGRYGRNFWRQAFERALKTAAQGALALIPADTFNILDVDDWRVVLGAALTGAVLSIGTSVVTAPIGPADDPSIVRPEH